MRFTTIVRRKRRTGLPTSLYIRVPANLAEAYNLYEGDMLSVELLSKNGKPFRIPTSFAQSLQKQGTLTIPRTNLFTHKINYGDTLILDIMRVTRT